MSKQDSVARNNPRDTSAVGLNPIKRDAMGAAMRVLTRITGSELADRYNFRQAIDRVTYESTKTGFKTLGAATRTFKKVSGGNGPERLATAKNADYFDLTPTDDQQMIAETVRDFAAEILRPPHTTPTRLQPHPPTCWYAPPNSASRSSTCPRHSTALPPSAGSSPTASSQRPSRTATWVWLFRSSRRAASRWL